MLPVIWQSHCVWYAIKLHFSTNNFFYFWVTVSVEILKWKLIYLFLDKKLSGLRGRNIAQKNVVGVPAKALYFYIYNTLLIYKVEFFQSLYTFTLQYCLVALPISIWYHLKQIYTTQCKYSCGKMRRQIPDWIARGTITVHLHPNSGICQSVPR